MKIVKLRTSGVDKTLEALQEHNDFVELYAVGIKKEGGERIIHWFSSGNESSLRAVGVLEYLKFRLLEEKE
jgi:hypothetical protein